MEPIIPQPTHLQQSQTWRKALSEMITCPQTLLSLLDLAPTDIPWQWDKHFPLRVTKSFVERMKKGDPHDPLLMQVLSSTLESQLDKDFSYDPVADTNYNPVPGLIHKYSSRVLLTFTTSCAIHCRYCFRRHFPYQDNNLGRQWDQALAYISQHPQIMEVILSGGDPLMAQDDVISQFLSQLDSIKHVNIVRIHTRLPVVIPQRITASLIKALSDSRFQIVMVYHINHPNEITNEITDGVTKLTQNNITVLNQSVLLKGVNDNAQCLKDLSIYLFKAGILPYYVNLLDPVQGSKHFFVDNETAKSLQQELRASLPGYLVPKFVQEIPHRLNKTAIDLMINN